MTAPVVRAGSVLCYRMFDVGDDVSLERAAGLARTSGLCDASEAIIGRRPTSTMDAAAVPLRVALGKRNISLPSLGRSLEATCTIHLFSTGTVSVCYTFPIAPGTSLEALLPLCQELYVSSTLEATARREADALVAAVGGAITGVHVWDEFEDYTVVLVRAFEGDLTADAVLQWPGFPKLILGEPSPKPLAHKQRQDILQHAFGYLDEDLVVIDWNSAFVLDPAGGAELVDVLEFANSILLNVRYYDDLLDVELRHIYAELSRTRQRNVIFSPYAKFAHEVMRNWLGLSEVLERIDNAIKVAGETYAARIYREAVVRLRIDMWNESIDRKQRLVSEAYGMLKGEAELRKSLALEVAVVVLIVIEIIVALRGHGSG
ncbi:hypothetical protein LVJ94_40185 [Pendulispora rubella]|uniref:DUF155 domain-containing protein n=1 Tax=Pendulispora rubella TaxID=2741070 RepID=A0ABZ2KYG1_9BACT